MDDIEKQKVKKNFAYITENTTNIGKLLTLLFQDGIIDSREREEIEFGKTQYAKNTDLYNLLMKKCPFEVLLKCLEDSSNIHIANKIKSTKIFHEPEKIIIHGIPSFVPFCTGREDELQKLYQLWENHRDGNRVPFISVHGAIGSGKSLLISDFIRLWRENTNGSCVNINAETLQTATEGIRTLAQKLQISLWDVDHREKWLASLSVEIYSSLSKTPSVLVINNIGSYEQPLIENLVRVSKNNLDAPKNIPFVILVSQNEPSQGDFGFGIQEVKLSSVLEEAKAENCFITNFPLQEQMKEEVMPTVKKLCQLLRGHPMAMELAWRLISVFQMDTPLKDAIGNYIEEMENLITEENIQGISLMYEIEAPVVMCYFAWKLSWKKILENKSESVTEKLLLKFVSFFSTDVIQTSFLLSFVKTEEINDTNLNNALKILFNCGLITSFEGNFSFCARKLLQKFGRIEMDVQNISQQTLETLLSAMLEKLKEKTVPVSQISHIVSVWNHSTKYKDLVVKYAELPVWICLNLFQNGRWEDVLHFCESSRKVLHENIGENNRWTLRLLYWKGRIHFERGVYVDSMNILKSVFIKQVAREYVHHSLITAQRIALISWKQGDKQKALDWLKRTLSIRILRFGENHINTQFVKNDMARVLSSMGEFKKARVLFEQVYAVRANILGESHPETVMAKFHIGNLLLDAKMLNEAIGIFKEVKEKRERILEPDHRDTIRVKHFMALTYKCMGRWRVGLPLAKEVFQKRIKLLGVEHPFTNYTRNLVRHLEHNLNRINQSRK